MKWLSFSLSVLVLLSRNGAVLASVYFHSSGEWSETHCIDAFFQSVGKIFDTHLIIWRIHQLIGLLVIRLFAKKKNFYLQPRDSWGSTKQIQNWYQNINNCENNKFESGSKKCLRWCHSGSSYKSRYFASKLLLANLSWRCEWKEINTNRA